MSRNRTQECFAAIGAASITAQILTGRTIEQVHTDLRPGLLTAHDIITLLGGLPEGKEHCAVLAEQAVKRAFESGANSSASRGEF